MGGDLTDKKWKIDEDKIYWWLTVHGWRRVDSLYMGVSYTKNGYHLYHNDLYVGRIDNGKWSFEQDYMQAELPAWALREGDNPVLDVLARDRFTLGEVSMAVERLRVILMIDRMENA